MSNAAVGWALSQCIADATTKLLLIALADFANDEHACWPSQARLSEIVGCSVDTVQRHAKRLESDGYMKRERRALANGNRTTDRYVLNVDVQGRKKRSRATRTTPQDAASSTPQNAALMTPHMDAASSTPQMRAVGKRTTKVEPPVVRVSTREGLDLEARLEVEVDGYARDVGADDEVPT